MLLCRSDLAVGWHYITTTAYLHLFLGASTRPLNEAKASNTLLLAHCYSHAQMARDIKFTSFGIPYILEFEKVSFAPDRPPTEPQHSTPSSSTSSFCYIDSPPPRPRFPSFSLPSASSLFKRKPSQRKPTRPSRNNSASEPPLWCASSEGSKPLPPPPQSDVSETHGIYIQFPAEHNNPQMSRKERLVRLQQTISMAVLDAGMSRSPGNTTHSEKPSDVNAKHGSRGYRTPDALFCGTYGQVVAALEGAGLSATPYPGEDSSGRAYLLFSFEDPSCTRISAPL